MHIFFLYEQYPNQSAGMCKLIWVFVGHTSHWYVFSSYNSYSYCPNFRILIVLTKCRILTLETYSLLISVFMVCHSTEYFVKQMLNDKNFGKKRGTKVFKLLGLLPCGHVKGKSAFEHVQNVRNHIILQVCNVSSGSCSLLKHSIASNNSGPSCSKRR